MRRKNIKNMMLGGIILLVAVITVGYATLTTTLTTTGTTTIKGNNWNVRFASVTKTGGVEPTKVPSADGTENGKTVALEYAVTLTAPGEYYEFDAVIENKGTIDAKLSAAPILTGENPVAKQTITYQDGSPIETGDVIPAGESVTVKVRVEFLSTVTNETLPSTDNDVEYKIQLIYVQG